MSLTPAYRPGDPVIFGSNGVHLIREIATLQFGSAPSALYYVLCPVSGGGTVYIPVTGESALRRISTKEEIDRWIDAAEQIKDLPLGTGKLRITALDRLLQSGDCGQILWILKTLSIKSEEEQAKNKKLCANEERILASAKKRITEEFGYALQLPQEQVVPYILARIQKT